MEKKILLIAVYFTLTGACVNAQNKKNIAPPPPPPPPIENIVAPPPPPPALPPVSTNKEFSSVVIVNGNGYDSRIEILNGNPIVILEKDAVVQKIKLSTWNANRKYYEKKYGQLPPPPPPLPAEPYEIPASEQ